jgi:hypothetical protein
MDNEFPSAPGAAFVFDRSGTSWSQHGGALVGKHRGSLVQEGTSVALSADGHTAVIGGPRQEGAGAVAEEGGAWVFVEPGSGWEEQGELPVGSGASEDAAAGQSVAVSGDGTTAVVGGPGVAKALGTAWVYVRSAGTWSQQGPALAAEDATTEPQVGHSVSLSEDGSTALVGGYHDDTSIGAAWTFERAGSTWTQQQKIVGTGVLGGFATEGSSVALSADSFTALVGGAADNGGVGAAWPFVRNGPPGPAEPVQPPEEPPSSKQGSGSSSGNNPPSSSSSTGSGSTTAGIASTAAAIEELLLGCNGAHLQLSDAYIQGGHVALSGSAPRSRAGSRVEILFGTRLTPVAHATVRPDGTFSTTAPLPPARIREALSTRYEAELGHERSLHLKLTRRLLLEPPHAAATTVTLSGRLYPPLTKPVSTVVIEQQLECHRTTIAGEFKPGAGGRFRVQVKVPANARAAIFTLKSKVAANAHSLAHGFTTYSLPLPVPIG